MAIFKPSIPPVPGEAQDTSPSRQGVRRQEAAFGSEEPDFPDWLFTGDWEETKRLALLHGFLPNEWDSEFVNPLAAIFLERLRGRI